MAQTETSTSPQPTLQASNDAVFSISTNAAVHQVIDIAEARQTLADANSSSQSFTAGMIDFIRKVIGSEGSGNVEKYANLVSLRARAVAMSNTTVLPNAPLAPKEEKKAA